MLWFALRRLIDDGYRGPCEISIGAALSFDIQIEHGVHRPLVIVENGVFLTAAHRSRYPFHFPRWYDWEAPSALLHRCSVPEARICYLGIRIASI